jgi:D-3-phosphoglycerate dehydrogenase
VAEGAAEQMLAIFEGDRPPRFLNPEAWSRFAERYKMAFGISAKG